jgi:DNA repair exonuclease SbcCD nuclease subunit
MAIRFIHTGDWHIAKPFHRFDDEKAALLRDARARIPERIGALARREGAGHVLVAGDIFDTRLPADATMRRLAARLAQVPDVTWHLLPGNHDPATPNGLWRRFEQLGRPDNVLIYHEAGATRLGDAVDLLASPLTARHMARDPTEWMDDYESAQGRIRIGLAHGAVMGFGSSGEAGVLIDASRAGKARLDYMALGDWHGVKEIAPDTWYAGTPEPDQFPANEPGDALLIEIDAPRAPARVTRHRTARYEWTRHNLDTDIAARVAEIEQDLAQSGEAAGNRLLRIACTGRVTLEEEAALRRAIERLGDLAFHVEADLDALSIDTGQQTSQLFDDEMTRAVATRLMARISAGEDTIARRALRILQDAAGGAGGRT